MRVSWFIRDGREQQIAERRERTDRCISRIASRRDPHECDGRSLLDAQADTAGLRAADLNNGFNLTEVSPELREHLEEKGVRSLFGAFWSRR